MATDQGKLSNVNGLAIMAALTGQSIPATGTTATGRPTLPWRSARSPGIIAAAIRPTRLTPSHAWAREQNATFVETGPWLRAQYISAHRELGGSRPCSGRCATSRSAVGFCDVSTLGKIDVHGPDAGAFLDRLYINMFSSLPVGRARYGVMLREDGFVFDDGTRRGLPRIAIS